MPVLRKAHPQLFDSKIIPAISREVDTPFYAVYKPDLLKNARKFLRFPNAFGLTVRYAMKSNSNRHITNSFFNQGIHIDASSGYEAERVMVNSGVPGPFILLTSQVIPDNLSELFGRGVQYNACSLYQLEAYGQLFPGADVSVRINPGIGSGGTNRTNTGGPSSSFGIWHEYLPQVVELLKRHNLRLKRVHTHIGSGSDPDDWEASAGKSLRIVEEFMQAGYFPSILNLGGGQKIARVPGDKYMDINNSGKLIQARFEEFAERTGQKLHLEIEPGTALVANAVDLVSRVEDLKDTGEKGYWFIITDTGMTELIRPALYGSQHQIRLVPQKPVSRKDLPVREFVVSGHECESGSILTPASDDPEALASRKLPQPQKGDFLVTSGAGAYSDSMSTKGYNSFPEAPVVMVEKGGSFYLIKNRGTLEQLCQNEVPLFS